MGNIIGPQTFRDSEKPGYKSAYVAMLVGYSVKMISVLVLFGYMWSVIRKRDREGEGGIVGLSREEEREAVVRGTRDVTEIDNRGLDIFCNYWSSGGQVSKLDSRHRIQSPTWDFLRLAHQDAISSEFPGSLRRVWDHPIC